MAEVAEEVGGGSLVLGSLSRAGEADAETLAQLQALPDRAAAVATTAGRPGVAQRLAEARRERHETAVQEMRLELGAIRARLAVEVQAVCARSRERLADDDDQLQALFAALSSGQHLPTISHAHIQHVRTTVLEHERERAEIVQALVAGLEDIEVERTRLAGTTLASHGRVLRSIAFLLPEEVDLLLFRESAAINAALIANKRTRIELRAKLMAAEAALQRKRLWAWEKQHAKWRASVQQTLLESASSAVAQDAERILSLQQDAMSTLLRDLRASTQRRQAHFSSMLALVKSDVQAHEVQQWTETLAALHTKLTDTNAAAVSEMRVLVGRFESLAEDKLTQLERELVAQGAASADEAAVLIQASVRPLVLTKTQSMGASILALEEFLERMAKGACVEPIIPITKLLQDTSALWAASRHAIEEQEHVVVSQADQFRRASAKEREDAEAHVASKIDDLRQGSNKDELLSLFNNIRDQLTAVQSTFSTFRDKSVAELKKHPQIAESIFKEFEAQLCSLIRARKRRSSAGKDKDRPKSRMTSFASEPSPAYKPIHQTLSEEGRETPLSVLEESGPGSGLDRTAATPDRSASTFERSAGTAREKEKEKEVETVTGETFVVLGEKPARGKSQSIFVTEESLGDLAVTLREAMQISPASIDFSLREAWLNFLVLERVRTSSTAFEFSKEKGADISAEIEAHLQVHQSRIKRIEQDVHNVRAAELVLHRERVLRHCQGMEEELLEQQRRFQEVKADQEKAFMAFQSSVGEVTSQLPTVSTTRQLEVFQEKQQTLRREFEVALNNSLRLYRQSLEAGLKALRESNGAFRSSFKTFSEKGNFSVKEIFEFKNILNKVSDRIDQAETSVLADLDGMESQQLALVSECCRGFDVIYNNHFRDVDFFQKSQKFISALQVEVKSEVAKSNGVSESVHALLSSFTSVFATATPDTLVSFAETVNRALQERAAYLGMTKIATPRSNAPLRATPSIKPAEPPSEPKGNIRPRPRTGQRTQSSHHIVPKGRFTYTVGTTRVQLEEWAPAPPGTFEAFLYEVQTRVRKSILDICVPFYDKGYGKSTLRPQFVKENLQAHMDHIQQQIATIRRQAVEYLDNCKKEFTDQTRQAMECCARIPRALFSITITECRQRASLEALKSANLLAFEEWLAGAGALLKELRPNLSHPAVRPQLDALAASYAVHTQLAHTLAQQARRLQAESASKMVDDLVGCINTAAARLLQTFDKTLLPQDLIQSQIYGRTESMETIGEGELSTSDAPAPTSPQQQAHSAQPMVYTPLNVASFGLPTSTMPLSTRPAGAPAIGSSSGGRATAAPVLTSAPVAQSVALLRSTALHTETVSTRDELVLREKEALGNDMASLSSDLMAFEKASQVHAAQWTAAEAQLRTLHGPV